MENQSNAPAQQAQPLTPEVALQNLVVAARQARLTYQEHAIIDASINTLAKAIGGNDTGPIPLPPE
jgi:predicted amidohydrolase YtcJ